MTFEIDYTLEDQNLPFQGESEVTLRLTDADGVIVQEDTDVNDDGDGIWSYSTDDLSSTGDYIFTIEIENGNMNYDIVIDVTY